MFSSLLGAWEIPRGKKSHWMSADAVGGGDVATAVIAGFGIEGVGSKASSVSKT